MLSLTEASKETGLTRSGIFKAIKSGKLSAGKDERGRFTIDASELFRVYKPVNKATLTSEQLETNKETQNTSELTDRLELMNRLLKQVESERDDLRRRLDEESEERRKLMNMLTHQPGNSEPGKSGFFDKLFSGFNQ